MYKQNTFFNEKHKINISNVFFLWTFSHDKVLSKILSASGSNDNKIGCSLFPVWEGNIEVTRNYFNFRLCCTANIIFIKHKSRKLSINK